MTRELADIVRDNLRAFDDAEQKPRLTCTRCGKADCLDLPWIDRPICAPCWAAIERQQAVQSEQELFVERRTDSGLPYGFHRARFADFKQPSPYGAHQLQVAKTVYDTLQAGQRGVVLIGPSGCGKTHLLAAAANFALKSGPVHWLDKTQLQFELGRSIFGKSPETVEPFGRRLLKAGSVVFLDDFSYAAKPYDWLRDALAGFFNDLVSHGSVQLFLSTNNRLAGDAPLDPVTRKPCRDLDDPPLIEIFGKAVVSRLKQLTLPTLFTGPDRRLA